MISEPTGSDNRQFLDKIMTLLQTYYIPTRFLATSGIQLGTLDNRIQFHITLSFFICKFFSIYTQGRKIVHVFNFAGFPGRFINKANNSSKEVK